MARLQPVSSVRVLQTWCQAYGFDPPEGQCASLYSLALDSTSPLVSQRCLFRKKKRKLQYHCFHLCIQRIAYSFFSCKLLTTISWRNYTDEHVCVMKTTDPKESRLLFLLFFIYTFIIGNMYLNRHFKNEIY